ncbi:MAG: HAD-IA family hydrolase [Oscillospiraceae bacterium]|nr:HAD-IA family hydrolase [Oscillospiraceae bacterium]
MFNCVIFDLDGTLIDTRPGIIESVQYTIKKLGLRSLSQQKLLTFIGPPLLNSFINACGCTEDQALQAVKVFREYYQHGAVFDAKPYIGIKELCDELALSGVKMGVATNKPQRFADALMKKFGLDKFDAILGADEEGKLTKSELIRLCMSKLEVECADTVMVGDTENDAKGAEKACVGFIAVTYGYGYRTEDDINGNVIGVANSPFEIKEIVLNH